MLCVPIIEAIAFWVLLRSPQPVNKSIDSRTTSMTASTAEIKDVTTVDLSKTPEDDDEKPLTGLSNKIRYIPSLFKYIFPLSMVSERNIL